MYGLRNGYWFVMLMIFLMLRFYNFKIGKESIIVIRSNEKDVNAFYNVCPHRGNRLINEDFGFLENRLLFHSWVFDLDGNNEQVLDKETLEKRFWITISIYQK